MKKVILFILLTVLFSSCKLIKYASQEEFHLVGDKMVFYNDNSNKMLVRAKIDSVDANLIFDTGSGLTVITNDEFIKGKNAEDALKFGSATLPNGKKISSNFYPTELKTDLFLFEKNLVVYLPKEKNKCFTGYLKIDGLLGMSFLTQMENKTLFFDFDNKLIEHVNDEKKKSLIENMTLVKADFFKGKHFKIYIEIDSKEIPFLFDTGNSAYELAVASDFETAMTPNNAYEGIAGILADGSFQFAEIDYFKGVDVSLSGVNSTNTLAKVSSLSENNVGVKFIRQYNWLIDYKNKEVYFSKRNESIEKLTEKERKEYYVVNHGDSLMVALRNKKANKYQLNDQIIEIDGERVTRENICEKMKFLNKKDTNWDKVQIKTKK